MSNFKQNHIFKILRSLKLIDPNQLKKLANHTRDKKNIGVYQCQKSGLIFLSKNIDSTSNSANYYKEQNRAQYWGAKNRTEALKATKIDDKRRANQFKNLIKNKIWLDFGTGNGGILDLLKSEAKATFGVEIQTQIRTELKKLGYEIFENLDKTPNKKYEIITLFHVLEHLSTPIEILVGLKDKMAPGGKIIIEVPHAKDALITLYDLPEFKEFTFWSEHLLLHTEESLKIFLKQAGFKNIKINGYQRYPLANHLYWLRYKKPGGQNIWPFLSTPKLDKEYANILAKNNLTDTLIATAQK